VSGSIQERLEKIMKIYNLKPVMEIDKAIALANEEVKKMQIEIEAANM
ncbi:ATP/GTP-binding protein, partial [Bacillus thuringiensis]